MEKSGYIGLVKSALENYSELPALSDFKGDTITFKEVGKSIYRCHQVFKALGIKPGDKVALIGRNSTNWALIYLSTVTYGAIIVPILPDFSPSDINHIVNHSESLLLFTSDQIFDKIDETKMPSLKGIISVNDFSVIVDNNGKVRKAIDKAQEEIAKTGDSFDVGMINFFSPKADDIMVLSYTSGTSGFSKGVLLPHRSIWSNVQYARDTFDIVPGERIVSFLPLAHTYGCLFEFLWPFTEGCHVTFLSRTPSPQIITEAFRNVKPHLILSVPLVLEKIFKKQILPQLEKKSLKALLKLPVLNKLVYARIKDKLTEAFGGEFREMVIGGAALNKDVEIFLRKIGFPLTVGYGMTECGPLISYAPWDETKPQSAGRIVHRMEVKIDSDDPYNKVGEILVRGENNMIGYYKNKQATSEVLDSEGWLHTGDLGIIDKDNFIFIKGRSKNMILGPSGQNIYPEEIEAVINNKEYVQECLVREDNGKIEALVYPDYEAVDAENLSDEDIEKILQNIKKEVNQELPAFMTISRIVLFPEEFEKTPKNSIKRYKYQS
ncbi:MAG: long-chain acyl-CoA synthetase [Anaerophaga sp.]|uniref:AMP-binding protein n=1 Tax=Anaerophaga thermohalophila TaxID=177400 RepID=UPI000237C6E1|nr:AMP-binding protein [Anaerophaga thermohalophila]MDN5292695.1 long-chain acyl-CoA synthetase [Anaerophaga sp.]